MFRFECVVTATEKSSIIKYNGVLVYSSVLKFIERFDSALATRLHDTTSRKPFGVTALVPRVIPKNRKKPEYIFQPGEQGSFKLLIHEKELYMELLRVFTENVNEGFTIGESEFSLLMVNFEQFNFDQAMHESEVITRAKIKFLSPTFFKQSKPPEVLLYPEPRAMIHSLIDHWLTFHGDIQQPPEGLEDWVENNVQVLFYSLKTRKAPITKTKPLNGFVGTIILAWDNHDAFGRWMSILLRYAEFCNIGSKRTFGFGEVAIEFS